MSRAICFRCDWEGETSGRRCPRCRTPLFRPEDDPPRQGRRPDRSAPATGAETTAAARGAAAASRVASRARGIERPPALGDPTSGELVKEPADRRRAVRSPLSALAAFAVLVAALAAAYGTLAPERERPAPVASPTPEVVPRGRLVFQADAGRLRTARSLWVLDLTTRGLRPGPDVPGADDLRSSGAGPDWLVLTRRTDDGQTAYLVRGVGSSAVVDPVAHGDLIGVGAGGRALVVGRQAPASDGSCERATSIRRVDLADGTEDVLVADRRCTRLLSVGMTTLTVYYSQAGPDGVDITRAGVGFDRRAIPDRLLLDVSAVGTLLVARVDGVDGLEPGPRADARTLASMRVTVVSTEVFLRSRGREVRVLGRGVRLGVERVLAWSPDGDEVVVLGRTDDGLGLFAVGTDPGRRPRPLAFLGAATADADAVYGDDGFLYLAVNGGLYVVRDGQPEPLLRPRGAPRVTGPLAWLP